MLAGVHKVLNEIRKGDTPVAVGYKTAASYAVGRINLIFLHLFDHLPSQTMDPSERASETADVWVIPPDLKGPAGLFAPPSPSLRRGGATLKFKSKSSFSSFISLPALGSAPSAARRLEKFWGYSDHVLCIIPFLIPFHRLLFAGLDVIWI